MSKALAAAMLFTLTLGTTAIACGNSAACLAGSLDKLKLAQCATPTCATGGFR